MDAQAYIDVDPKTAGLRNIQEYFSKAGRVFCAGCLLAIIASTSLSVFCRYVFFFPLNFSDPLSVLLLTWMVFVGSGLAIAAGEHVFVDYFLSRFSPRLKRVMTVFTAIVMSFFLIIISYYGYLFSWAMHDSTDPLVFNMSMMIPYLSVPVGATYSLIQLWFTALIVMMTKTGGSSGQAREAVN